MTGLDAKRERLERILGEIGSALVAYSGGVDSTLLLKVARDVLGDKVEEVFEQAGELTCQVAKEALAGSGASIPMAALDEIAQSTAAAPRAGEGLAEPDLSPPFPQRFAEIMVGEVPTGPAAGRTGRPRP